jgi:hypothetical protein
VIIVHQMAKVASQSWVQAARPAAAIEGSAPFHSHFIIPANRQRIEAAYDVPTARQTIANMLMPRNMLRTGAAAWAQIEAARQSGERIRVVTGMRDPVARSISLIVFMVDFYGHVSRPLSPQVAISAEYVIEALLQTWQSVLDQREPNTTFEWLLWYLTGAFRSWFFEEFAVAYGVDPLAGPDGAWDGARRINAGSTEILLYRAEDMAPSANGHAGLLAATSAFLGAPVEGFVSVNTSDTRRSRALSAEIRARFRLPREWLDTIYNEAIMRRFYRSAEIAAFKQQWS